MKLLIPFLEKSEGLLRRIKKNMMRNSDEQFKQVELWHAEDPHGLKKSDFNFLTSQSMVFDLGGYEGQWSSDIFARYESTIHIFEPVRQYADLIKARFVNNKKIHTHTLGLAEKDSTALIKIDLFASRVIDAPVPTENTETILLKEFNSFLKEHNIATIDLIKINIEGGEFELLEHLINTGTITSIKALLIQFHNFVPDAYTRREQLQKKLVSTHHKMFDYPFVWELWTASEH